MAAKAQVGNGRSKGFFGQLFDRRFDGSNRESKIFTLRVASSGVSKQRHRKFAALRDTANQLEANIARFSPENYNFEKEIPGLLCNIQFSIPSLMEEGRRRRSP